MTEKLNKVRKIDDAAFFVLGDYTIDMIDYSEDTSQISPIIGEPFDEIPELLTEPGENDEEILNIGLISFR